MEILKQQIAEHVEANSTIDWQKIKQVLITIVATIDSISATLPAGVVKTILNVASSMLTMIINLLPT